VIFFAKATGNLVFLLIVQVLTIPVFAFLFLQEGSYAGEWWMIPLALFAGAVGISGVGTLLATMSVNTKGKDFVLAVLFVPLMYPLLLAAVSATSAAILGGDGSVQQFWTGMGMMAAFDVIMLLASFALYEFIVGA
jgi:heme exporter protein B